MKTVYCYRTFRILFYLSLAISGFFNLVVALGLLLGQHPGLLAFALVILAAVLAGCPLMIVFAVKRKWNLAAFCGLAVAAAILISYLLLVGRILPVFYTGHLHIVLVPLFGFLTSLFYHKAYVKSTKRRGEERPLKEEESIIGK